MERAETFTGYSFARYITNPSQNLLHRLLVTEFLSHASKEEPSTVDCEVISFEVIEPYKVAIKTQYEVSAPTSEQPTDFRLGDSSTVNTEPVPMAELTPLTVEASDPPELSELR